MYGEPFIDLATGQRLRALTDACGRQRLFLNVWLRWRARHANSRLCGRKFPARQRFSA
jgi:hypothetical protein